MHKVGNMTKQIPTNIFRTALAEARKPCALSFIAKFKSVLCDTLSQDAGLMAQERSFGLTL
ncbi:hypothetical protein PG5_27550 [Pseudomonas sp. G5(2012)]|jgi:hypothetical protein|nr:hypothetical protein PG5_27550 [Pseudomonas sp. G5(2012)]